jgi:hypothetical protein
MRALMGLDLGEKTIGISVSDRMLSVASPLETVRRVKFTADAARVLEIAQAREVGGLILGLPRNMDGSEGSALPIHPRLCPQPEPADRSSDRVLGRTAVDRGRGTRVAGGGYVTQASRAGDRSCGRWLYPARCA